MYLINTLCPFSFPEISPADSENDLHVFENSCSEASANNLGINQKYVELIRESEFSDLCLADRWNGACSKENVKIIC